MPVSPTYPGVYVQEVPSGVRTIVGVGTSTAMFIGESKKGPMFAPIRCSTYSVFRDRFGEDSSVGLLAHYVRLFFLNGGTDCWVMRIAQGASASTVTLLNEAAANTLILTAKDPGLAGEDIRALVTYDGPQPEVTFNLELFRWVIDSSGRRTKQDREIWRNLSMDPTSPGWVESFITQNSKLVNVTDLNGAPAAGTMFGSSTSGRAVEPVAGLNFQQKWGALLGSLTTTNRFKLSLSGTPPIDIDLHTIVVPATSAALETLIAQTISTTFAARGYPGMTVNVQFLLETFGIATRERLRITKTGTNGDVFIRPGDNVGGQGDLAVMLMLGTEQGGIEVSGFAARRPAPTGISLRASIITNIQNLATRRQNDLAQLDLESVRDSDGAHVLQNINLVTSTPSVVTGVAGGTDPVSLDAYIVTPNDNSDGIREKLDRIVTIINNFTPPTGHSWRWRAERAGSRLVIFTNDDDPDNFVSANFALIDSAANAISVFTNNVHYYSLGAGGFNSGSQISAVSAASDGTSPLTTDYDLAYPIIDREVDLFNLMVLPPTAVPATVQSVYGNASVFCQSRRAFLVLDPPSSWTDAQSASTGVSLLRPGLVNDYSAVFFPRITIDDAGLKKHIGPAGAIAGLCARIDGTRGVWKAPAGTEASLRGIVGLERQFSDGENGVLNPKAVNTLRIFPNGIVNWGARTMDGDDSFPSEYKYIPVRRTALFIEESLYRGLKWVVFEPNDEALWAQIRLNVGAFMHDLFVKHAFQSLTASPADSYFVKCNSETTTQTDINLGIVNIWVGFAPLKPAEFVILYLQQMAGQIQP